MAAVALAFAQHRPLVLSPDAVWLTIAQGVAQHVRLHAEACGRTDGRARLFECDFSTTTDVDRLASQIIMLDVYSPYFSYWMTVRMLTRCPGNTVTLSTGAVDRI